MLEAFTLPVCLLAPVVEYDRTSPRDYCLRSKVSPDGLPPSLIRGVGRAAENDYQLSQIGESTLHG